MIQLWVDANTKADKKKRNGEFLTPFKSISEALGSGNMILEIPEIKENKIKKARKIHICIWCSGIIKKGEKYNYIRIAGKKLLIRVFKYCNKCTGSPGYINYNNYGNTCRTGGNNA